MLRTALSRVVITRVSMILEEKVVDDLQYNDFQESHISRFLTGYKTTLSNLWPKKEEDMSAL